MVTRHVVTLANSIVGVSVLAMPFCFKQCGIVLATLCLMIGAVMTRMVCYFLLKAAVMSRRRTYEMLAWSTFGQTGKFLVEISIIGFLIGTLIAFMVVIGDLGPEILSEMLPVENNSSLRTIIMTALSLFVALPLGLLRNIDSLSSVSTASVLFYLFLVIKIFSEGFGPLWSGEYLERIHFWRSAGVLQCIPIFSMALSCQTQVFGIYDALPEPSLQKMNEVVKRAVYVCTFFYFSVGFFGYIAFSQHNFGGNILLSFTPEWSTQLIKSMFLMSVVFSVPLVVFPCRASLHSLMFRSAAAYHHVHDMSTNYIPDSRMKLLTITIVSFTLVIGILIPNIELVLGLVGSTTGSVICIIFPSIMFVRVTSKNTTERLLAQFMFFVGMVLMFLTTYATLYAAEQTQMKEHIPDQFRVTPENLLASKPIARQNDVQLNSPISKLDDSKLPQIHNVEFEHKAPDKMISKDNIKKEKMEFSSPKPSTKKESDSPKVKTQSNSSNKLNPDSDVGQQPQPKDTNVQEKPIKTEERKTEQDGRQERVESKPVIAPAPSDTGGSIKSGQETEQKQSEIKANPQDIIQPPQNSPSENQPSAQVLKDDTKKEFVDKHVAEEFLKRLEEHQENQKKLLAEQKEILQELKQHHAQDVHEKIEKDRQKENENNNIVESPINSDVNANHIQKDEGKDSVQSPPVVDTADKIIQGQEKIIEKISENIEKESKNAQILEKMENLVEEGKLVDKQVNIISGNIPSDPENKAPETVKQQQETHGKMQNQQDNYRQAPKENFNDVLKGIDKEKGVLVGSLSVGKLNDPSNLKDKESSPGVQNVSPNKMQNVEQEAVPDIVQHQGESQSHGKKLDDPSSNKMIKQDDAFKQNDQKADIKSEINNPPAVQHVSVPLPSSSSPVPPKKIEPEKVQKEKIDREI